MTSDEFWKDNPDLFFSYRTSFILKEKRKAEYDNYVSWLNGLYNCKSFSVVYSNAWNKNSKETYFNYPLDVLKNEEKNKPSKEKQREILQKQYEQDCMFFSSIKQRFIETLSQKGE